MSDTSGSSTVFVNPLGTLGTTIANKVIRAALLSVATLLTGYGALKTDQQGAFIEIGVGVLSWAGTMAWSIYQARVTHETITKAALAPAARSIVSK